MESHIWLDRSKVSLDKRYKGVLFSRFPDSLNDYLHHWTSQLIIEHITGKDGAILDIGCGYGRLSSIIRERFPGPLLIGLDISPTYTREFLENVRNGFSVLSNSVHLPFKKKRFDVIFEVFSLMYLPDKKTYQAAIREMLSSLKDEGTVLIIENNKVGTYFLNGFGILSFLSRIIRRGESLRTKGLLFHYFEIDKMVRQNRCVVVKKVGMPLFTLMIPLNVLLGCLSATLVDRCLSLIHLLDPKLQFMNFLSLYQFYLIKKTGTGTAEDPARSSRSTKGS